jgi:hypothetical protein
LTSGQISKQIPIDITEMANMNPLSLAYDNKTLYNPYATRVNGALLPLLFFNQLENSETNFLFQDSCEYLEVLSKEAIQLKAKSLEPNQIFMLMFSESINQSIISDLGSNYEDRIFQVLTNIGIAS